MSTYVVVCQTEDDKEDEQTVTGTSATFDEASQRLTILNDAEPVAGFIRVLRWMKKD
jgi:hypothetical protein